MLHWESRLKIYQQKGFFYHLCIFSSTIFITMYLSIALIQLRWWVVTYNNNYYICVCKKSMIETINNINTSLKTSHRSVKAQLLHRLPTTTSIAKKLTVPIFHSYIGTTKILLSSFMIFVFRQSIKLSNHIRKIYCWG